MRFGLMIFALALVLFALGAPRAQAADDWEALLANMSRDDPALAAEWEKAKKAAEKNEKDLKKIADQQFQSAFDTVFGKDVFKPSEGLDVLKMIEAASAGDFETAGKVGSEFLIAKYTPGLGQYIMVMQAMASGIKSAEQIWINGLKQTRAYDNFISAIFDNPDYDRPYIPSYMITYMRNNKTFGPQISKVYDEMRAREDRMFGQWMNDEDAVDQMSRAPWASRWVSARGKVPTEREMFNYFLYNLVKDAKGQYLEKFSDYYLDPMVRREARQQKQRLKSAMRQAVSAIAAKAEGSNQNSAQCKTWLGEYKAFVATNTQAKKNFRAYADGVYKDYTNKFDNMLVSESAARKQRFAPWYEEQDQLEQENEELNALEDDVDSARAELASLRSEVNSAESALPSDKSDPSYNTGIDSVNAAIRQYNSARQSRFMPAKQAYESAATTFNRKNDDFKTRYKAFRDQSRGRPASQKLVSDFSRIRQSIQLFQKGKTSCTTFAKYAVKDNMRGLIGIDPAPGIALCDQWKASLISANAAAKTYREACE
ncbi:MAG: hypothetical protein Q9M33_09005 [Robiginitomaculum sp.]|nr:hypothetical protein [Robiginitomaculum sp.]MDQ7076423.1 hypothetical protein [Robiginitomaculum sp.]